MCVSWISHSLPGLSRNRRESAKAAQSTYHNAKSSPLARLPIEILELILQYDIAPSGLQALGITCRRLYLDTSLAKAQLEEDEKRKLHTLLQRDHLQTLCILERSRQGPSSRAVCSGCVKTHGKLLFTLRQLKQPPEARVCVGREGVLWVCAHLSLSWDELRNSLRQSLVPYSHWSPTIDPCCFGPLLSYRSNRDSVQVLCLDRVWDLLLLPSGKFASSAKVKAALEGLDIPLCPHVCTSDLRCVVLYDPSRFTKRSYGYCSQYSPICARCDVHVWYRYSRARSSIPVSDSWWNLGIHVVNTIGRLKEATDPKWLSAMIDPGRSMTSRGYRYATERCEWGKLNRIAEARCARIEHYVGITFGELGSKVGLDTHGDLDELEQTMTRMHETIKNQHSHAREMERGRIVLEDSRDSKMEQRSLAQLVHDMVIITRELA